MRLRIEISEDGCEEIVIRCHRTTEQTKQIETLIEGFLKSKQELVLHASGADHYIAVGEILFFESSEGKVYAHTKDGIYTTEHTLSLLGELLPAYFVRSSKPATANVRLVRTVRRELVGNGELTFGGSGRKVYFSRSYYKDLKQKLEEMRSIV